jgi:hypothetical protein
MTQPATSLAVRRLIITLAVLALAGFTAAWPWRRRSASEHGPFAHVHPRRYKVTDELPSIGIGHRALRRTAFHSRHSRVIKARQRVTLP